MFRNGLEPRQPRCRLYCHFAYGVAFSCRIRLSFALNSAKIPPRLRRNPEPSVRLQQLGGEPPKAKKLSASRCAGKQPCKKKRQQRMNNEGDKPLTEADKAVAAA